MKARAPVAYLHGFASSPRATKALALADHFRTVGVPLLVPDLNVPSFSHLSRAAMLDVVGALAPHEKLRLIGSSLGGWLAARFAELHPERVERLVLLCPAFDMAARWPSLFGDEAFVRWRRDGTLGVPDAEGVKQPLHWDFVEEGLREPAWPTVPCETLIVHGTRDETVPVEGSRAYAARLPDRVRLVEVDDDHRLHASVDRVASLALAFLTLVLLALVPLAARAQDLVPETPESQIEHPLDRGVPGPSGTPGQPVGHRLALEFGVYDGRIGRDPGAPHDFLFALAGSVAARLLLAPEWQLDLVIPFAFAATTLPIVNPDGTPTGSRADASELRTGDPFAGVALVPRLPPEWHVRAGLGFALPAVQLSDNVVALDAIRAGLAMNGAASRWLWSPSALSFVWQGSVERDLGSAVLGAQLALGLSLCLDATRCPHVVDVPLEPMLFLAAKLRADGESRVGVRVRLAALPTANVDAQWSVEPYVHVRIERFFLDGRFVMNLSAPYGFAFDQGGAWGLFVGAGVID